MPLLSSETIISLFMNVMTIMSGKVCLDSQIAQMSLDGKVVAEYDNIRDAAKETGIPYSGIYACVNGKTKKSNGFVWKKIEK